MSLKGVLGGIDVDVIPEQYSTDQSPPGLLGTYKRLDGIKGREYRTSSWHWVNSIYCTNLNRHVGTQGTDRGNIFVHIVIPFILEIRLVDAAPAGVTQEEDHKGFLHLPSAVFALIFIARRIQPSLSLVDRDIGFCVPTN